jgi:ABC-2 type transport system permease protein
MIRGKGWNDIAFNVFILLTTCVVFMIANVFVLKKYRKI